MEFEPINTKEDFEARVKEAYGDVDDLKDQVETLTGEKTTNAATIAELQKKVREYETNELKRSIAIEKGIPMDIADRLTGEDEDALRADADAVAKMLREYKGPAPLHDGSPAAPDDKKADMRNMLNELRGD